MLCNEDGKYQRADQLWVGGYTCGYVYHDPRTQRGYSNTCYLGQTFP